MQVHAPLTIQQFVDEHKVVLYALFVKLAKVAPSNTYQAIAELEYESRIDVAFCNACYVYVQVADVEEGRAPEGEYRRLD